MQQSTEKKKEWTGTLNVADVAGSLEVVGMSSRLMQGTARRVARAAQGAGLLESLTPGYGKWNVTSSA
jgi:hypothetical protein